MKNVPFKPAPIVSVLLSWEGIFDTSTNHDVIVDPDDYMQLGQTGKNEAATKDTIKTLAM